MTDIPSEETTATSMSGIIYGRDKAWTARDFVQELSGSDPMGHIVSSVGRYWNKYRQSVLLGIINMLFNVGGTDANATDFKTNHILTTNAPIEPTDANYLMTQSLGDNKDQYSLAIMHSRIAMRLENLELLEFRKQTDANGIQRKIRLADWDGLTVVVDDGTTHSGDEYSTFLLGNGVIRQANGRQRVPAETKREPEKNNGQDTLYTRIRETIHPNGFSFKIPDTGWSESPTDAQLFDPANWALKFPAKSIPIAKLVTTETTV
jgi:hypothetical protein